MQKTLTPEYVPEPDFQSKAGVPYKNGQCRARFKITGKDGQDVWFSGFCDPSQAPKEGVEMTAEVWEDEKWGWQWKPLEGSESVQTPQTGNVSFTATDTLKTANIGSEGKNILELLKKIDGRLVFIENTLRSMREKEIQNELDNIEL